MVRDLMSVALSIVKDEMTESVQEEAEQRTEEALLDLLLPTQKKEPVPGEEGEKTVGFIMGHKEETREKLRKLLKDGKLEDKMVEISISKSAMPSIEIFSGTSFEEMESISATSRI